MEKQIDGVETRLPRSWKLKITVNRSYTANIYSSNAGLIVCTGPHQSSVNAVITHMAKISQSSSIPASTKNTNKEEILRIASAISQRWQHACNIVVNSSTKNGIPPQTSCSACLSFGLTSLAPSANYNTVYPL